jgi:hypothetical protein
MREQRGCSQPVGVALKGRGGDVKSGVVGPTYRIRQDALRAGGAEWKRGTVTFDGINALPLAPTSTPIDGSMAKQYSTGVSYSRERETRKKPRMICSKFLPDVVTVCEIVKWNRMECMEVLPSSVPSRFQWLRALSSDFVQMCKGKGKRLGKRVLLRASGATVGQGCPSEVTKNGPARQKRPTTATAWERSR